jgi:hypothetical protein
MEMRTRGGLISGDERSRPRISTGESIDLPGESIDLPGEPIDLVRRDSVETVPENPALRYSTDT